jgi:Ca2+-binding EF-hand superfamily protein
MQITIKYFLLLTIAVASATAATR